MPTYLRRAYGLDLGEAGTGFGAVTVVAGLVGTLLSLFAAIYYWAPLLFGCSLSEGLGRAHFAVTLVGFDDAIGSGIEIELDVVPGGRHVGRGSQGCGQGAADHGSTVRVDHVVVVRGEGTPMRSP